MNKLAENGTCKMCSKDASSEQAQCFICKEKLHVINCNAAPMVQASFFQKQWPNFLNNWPCISFICLDCREDVNTKENVVMSSRVRLLEESGLKTNEKLEDNTRQLSEIRELLEKVVNAPVKVSAPTYLEALTKPVKPKDTPALIVIDKAQGNEATSTVDNQAKISQVTKAAIQAKAGVNKSFTNKSGKTVFVCANEKSKNALLPHVEKAYGATRKITTPKARLPTISVPFIHGKYEKEELMNIHQQQNEEQGILFTQQNSQILFTTPMKDRDGLHQAVIRVSDEIRYKIKSNGDRLCIGINSCPVFDRFFIKRCNHCQSFHHFHKDNGGCKKAAVCALCTGNHDTRSCETPPNMYKCANCVAAKEEDSMHAAYSLDCPCYLAEQLKLKKTISYYTKNP